MIPKPILRYIIISFVAFSSAFFFLNKRQREISSPNAVEVLGKANDMQATNNDFIFFEALSKYLVVSFRR
jgi:hypothetical protein